MYPLERYRALTTFPLSLYEFHLSSFVNFTPNRHSKQRVSLRVSRYIVTNEAVGFAR